MFERFTQDARSVVVSAQDEARALRHPHIDTEHLLLAMLVQDGLAGMLLRARGMSAVTLRGQLQDREGPDSRLDPDALATLGIDLSQVRRAAEDQFGPGALAPNARPMPHGHIPFSKRAKKVLELAVREAVALDSHSINDGHLLLGVLREQSGTGTRLIQAAGVDVDELSAEARHRAGREAA